MARDHPQGGFARYLGVGLLSLMLALAPVWIWTIEWPLAYLDKEYPMWLAKMELIRKGETGGVVILGDSRAVSGLIPARLGPKVVNLALGGGTPIDSYYIAQKITGGPSLPRAVIISFAMDHFNAAEAFWGRSVEFGLLDFRELEEIRSRSRALGDESIFGVESPGDLDARLRSFLYSVRFPSYYFAPLIQFRGSHSYADNRKMFDLVLSNRGQGYFGLANGSSELEYDGDRKIFKPTRILDDYFNRLLALLQSRNIPVYFISMPHDAVSDRLYVPELREKFVAYLGNCAGRHANFHVLGDPFPSYPPEDFGDSTHLNERGAARWSAYVAHLLNDARAEGGPFGAP
jgi:hypothetical protein